MKVAKFIKTIDGWQGDARFYLLSPSLGGHSHVIVSAVVTITGPETYIFPATKDGVVADWGELPGSLKGTLEHEAALREAGYRVVL